MFGHYFFTLSVKGKGIGRELHDLMLIWYFTQTRETVWLATAPFTRAEQFYKRHVGMHGKDEI